MKKLLVITLITCLISGCSSKKELSREEAARILKESIKYPSVIDYDIYCADPAHAKKVLDGGLEEQGLVNVQCTQKLGDIGKPLIAFTDKAKPYLLPTPEKDKASNIQRVKIADEDLIEVTGIRMMESGNQAIADYTTTYKNISGFSALTKSITNQKTATRKAYFALYDDGWRLEQKR